MDVWSYQDSRLQSQQLSELTFDIHNLAANGGPQSYMAVIRLDDMRIIRLRQEDDDIVRLYSNVKTDSLVTAVSSNGGCGEEWNWNKNSRPSFYSISTITGERKQVAINYSRSSPNGKYLIGTDSIIRDISNNLLTYNLATGEICNITRSLPIPIDKSGSAWESLNHRDLTIARLVNQ